MFKHLMTSIDYKKLIELQANQETFVVKKGKPIKTTKIVKTKVKTLGYPRKI